MLCIKMEINQGYTTTHGQLIIKRCRHSVNWSPVNIPLV